MTAAELAAIAARAYRHMSPWSEADFASTLDQPATLLCAAEGAFVLGRVVVDEAEILALATDPGRQRSGAGRAVLARFETQARARGAVSVFLEVAAENTPATGFYTACGYRMTGLRKGYYKRPDGSRDDALLMSKALT
ncbi:ribosomal-protein-alanine acetyltransferase [Citreicella sp. SE45]|uniref:GNAT family N-acetyltransferase n=1 Tax=Salipiger sp. HF18 TaxID=2721557 RepID=UPI0001B8C61F|nr:ribosomal-protein-alanine acetyltransferase [Citreicella sp. SE45]NIY99546.1 GNAT family N-acetyltransferase [Salipiger sp. HF18]